HITAENIVVAVGTEPAPTPGVKPDGEVILTTDDVLRLQHLPRTLAVVGAGVIRIEYASIFAAIGVDRTPRQRPGPAPPIPLRRHRRERDPRRAPRSGPRIPRSRDRRRADPSAPQSERDVPLRRDGLGAGGDPGSSASGRPPPRVGKADRRGHGPVLGRAGCGHRAAQSPRGGIDRRRAGTDDGRLAVQNGGFPPLSRPRPGLPSPPLPPPPPTR